MPKIEGTGKPDLNLTSCIGLEDTFRCRVNHIGRANGVMIQVEQLSPVAPSFDFTQCNTFSKNIYSTIYHKESVMRIFQSDIDDFLRKKNLHLKCPICQSDLVKFREKTVFVTDSKDDVIVSNGQSQPYAVADCANCFHAMLFAVRPMGILK